MPYKPYLPQMDCDPGLSLDLDESGATLLLPGMACVQFPEAPCAQEYGTRDFGPCNCNIYIFWSNTCWLLHCVGRVGPHSPDALTVPTASTPLRPDCPDAPHGQEVNNKVVVCMFKTGKIKYYGWGGDGGRYVERKWKLL